MTVMAKVESRELKKTLFEILDHMPKMFGRHLWFHGTGPSPKNYREKLMQKDQNGDTTVHVAARLSYCHRLSPVLSEEVVSIANNIGVTPLHDAAYQGIHGEIAVRMILMVLLSAQCISSIGQIIKSVCVSLSNE